MTTHWNCNLSPQERLQGKMIRRTFVTVVTIAAYHLRRGLPTSLTPRCRRCGGLLLFALFAVLLFPSGSMARSTRDSVQIVYRQGYRYVEPSFGGNRAALRRLQTAIREAVESGTLRRVEIRAWASPEGASRANKRLASLRADSLASWIVRHGGVERDMIDISSGGVGWQMLREAVASSDAAYRDRVTALIDNTPVWVRDSRGRIIGGRKKILMELDGGRVWRDMYRRFFPGIRSSLAVVVYVDIPDSVVAGAYTPCRLPVAVVDEPEHAALDNPVEAFPVSVEESCARRLYLKTNLFGWGLAVGNIAVEADLADRWSLSLPIYYSGVDYFIRRVKFRTFTVQPELRYWPQTTCGQWFVGLHLGMAYYNIATGGDYRRQDHDGDSPAWGGGVSTGWRVPVGRRLRLELSIGAGVYRLHYDKFRNSGDGRLEQTRRRTYLGVDNLSVSFAYMFDLKRGKR